MFVRMRAKLLQNVLSREVFCHELQLEPWGERATQELSDETQQALMNTDAAIYAMDYAVATGLKTIDMWGLEWWYWRREECKDSSVWLAVKKYIKTPTL